MILALSVKFAERVKQHGLVLRLEDHEVYVDLFAVEQLDQNAVVVLLRDAVWVATSGLDECFQRTVEQFVDFTVVVVIVTNAWMKIRELDFE